MTPCRCSECGRMTTNYQYVRQKIQCRKCWELSNMPSYLRVQTMLPRSAEKREEE